MYMLRRPGSVVKPPRPKHRRAVQGCRSGARNSGICVLSEIPYVQNAERRAYQYTKGSKLELSALVITCGNLVY